MLDERLVGYWSDFDLYLGSMEAGEIAFRRDGDGWTHWSRDGGAFSIRRFSWRVDDGRLVLAMRELLAGIWTLRDGALRHEVRSRTAGDREIVLAYEVRPGRDVHGRTVTLFETDQEISLGTIGDRFAFQRELADGEEDPAVATSGRGGRPR